MPAAAAIAAPAEPDHSERDAPALTQAVAQGARPARVAT